jgi:hypothetical protein
MLKKLKTYLSKPAERNAYLVAAEFLKREANAMGIVDHGIRHKLTMCAERLEEHAKSIK